MHIEPGYLSQAKILMANASAIGVLGYYAKGLINPLILLRTVLAALFFTVFMEVYSVPVGPSELHFVGAMVMYLTLGFLPTVFGFAIGLLIQGLIFNPGDLAHLSVNTLSLVLPLILVQLSLGKNIKSRLLMSWKEIVRMDALYYSGVTTMVAFWLAFAEVATPFSAWLSFASSYLIIVAMEPLVTLGALALVNRFAHVSWIRNSFISEKA